MFAARTDTHVGSLARMSESPRRRFGLLRAREPKLPSERDWERSQVLEPRRVPRDPELVSDGGGLPFPPGALAGAPAPLDEEDPAVAALLARLLAQRTPKRGAAGESSPLDGWRLLARTEGEVLFARGVPPQLLTVAVRQDARRRTWSAVASSASRPLRATRDGIRASSWRLDPTHEIRPEDTVLRVLVTEQTLAGGQRADRRLLPPDIYLDRDELVLTMFVNPLPGYKGGSRNPETPVRIALPEPVGTRRPVDGALAQFRS